MDLSRRKFLGLGAAAAVAAVLPNSALAVTQPGPDVQHEDTKELTETRNAFVGRIKAALTTIHQALTGLESEAKELRASPNRYLDGTLQKNAYSHWDTVNGLSDELSKTLTTKFQVETYAAAESELFSQIVSLRIRVVSLAPDYFLMGM